MQRTVPSDETCDDGWPMPLVSGRVLTTETPDRTALTTVRLLEKSATVAPSGLVAPTLASGGTDFAVIALRRRGRERRGHERRVGAVVADAGDDEDAVLGEPVEQVGDGAGRVGAVLGVVAERQGEHVDDLGRVVVLLPVDVPVEQRLQDVEHDALVDDAVVAHDGDREDRRLGAALPARVRR